MKNIDFHLLGSKNVFLAYLAYTQSTVHDDDNKPLKQHVTIVTKLNMLIVYAIEVLVSAFKTGLDKISIFCYESFKSKNLGGGGEGGGGGGLGSGIKMLEHKALNSIYPQKH